MFYFFFADGYAMSDVYLYWRSGSVHNVENVELPQFSIVEYRAITKIESLLTGTGIIKQGDFLCKYSGCVVRDRTNILCLGRNSCTIKECNLPLSHL